MKKMSGKGNFHICRFMVLYLEDMNGIKALLGGQSKLSGFRNEIVAKFIRGRQVLDQL